MQASRKGHLGLAIAKRETRHNDGAVPFFPVLRARQVLSRLGRSAKRWMRGTSLRAFFSLSMSNSFSRKPSSPRKHCPLRSTQGESSRSMPASMNRRYSMHALFRSSPKCSRIQSTERSFGTLSSPAVARSKRIANNIFEPGAFGDRPVFMRDIRMKSVTISL